MTTELDELIEFLGATRVEVCKMAVDIVHGLTGSEDGVQQLAKKSSDVAPALLHLLQDKRDKDIARLAAESLVNLSEDKRVAVLLVLAGAVERCLSLLGESEAPVQAGLVMLLANLSQQEEGVNRILQVEDGVARGRHLGHLVRLFVQSSPESSGGAADAALDPFAHVASILVSVSRQVAGRRALLNPEPLLLLRLVLPHIQSPNAVRRQGVASTVRNCCFEAASCLPSLLLASQFLWPALLLPLAGHKPYSQEDRGKMPPELAAPLAFEREAEKDELVRREAADALYLIALQEGGRRALWSVNAPRILQVGYEDEEHPEVVEAYERLGSLLIEESGLHDDMGSEDS